MRKVGLAMAAIMLMLALAACGKEEPKAVDTAASANAREIKITAQNFDFDQKEIRIKKGETVKFTLENKEGMHGMEARELGLNVKGGSSQTITADKTGTFNLKCSIICGAGHGNMVSKIIVE
ncbi:cupredoxin domain-containing protein [Paenibacillus sp. CC-CFT747]|nr:cupredoxin domain-containing protein [Paenibacillus sp. CC-CFT747]